MTKNTNALFPDKVIDKESVDLWFEPKKALEEEKWARIPHFVHTVATFPKGGAATLLSATLAPTEWLDIPIMPGGNLRMVRSFSEAMRACNGNLQHDSNYWRWVVRGATKAWTLPLEDFPAKGRFLPGAFEVVGQRLLLGGVDGFAFDWPNFVAFDWPNFVACLYKENRLLEASNHYFLDAFGNDKLFVDGNPLNFRLPNPDSGENDPLAWRRQMELFVFDWACRRIFSARPDRGTRKDEKTIIRTLAGIRPGLPTLRWPLIQKEATRQTTNTMSFFNQSDTSEEEIPIRAAKILRELRSAVEKQSLSSLRDSIVGDSVSAPVSRGVSRRHL